MGAAVGAEPVARQDARADDEQVALTVRTGRKPWRRIQSA
ncbi:hypothetical protein MPHL43070_03745 [Mycolicibacterium phlei DSM 43070]|nr:hypothetical protein MPHL43070_03745 [Mycolicibacterium phlei DSM 43070]